MSFFAYAAGVLAVWFVLVVLLGLAFKLCLRSGGQIEPRA